MVIESASAQHLEGGRYSRIALPPQGEPENKDFALFYGAGQDFASSRAVEVFRRAHKESDDTPLLRDLFEKIHDAILALQAEPEVLDWCKRNDTAPNQICTAGLIARLEAGKATGNGASGSGPWVEFIGAGDLPLFACEHDTDRLLKLTKSGAPDTLLGTPGWHSDRIAYNRRGFTFLSNTTLALLGGEAATGQSGLSEPAVLEILHEDGASCEDKAQEILRATQGGDAGVIVLEVKL